MRHILWMKGGGLGDFVLALPVLRALRRHYPGARLDVAGPAAFLPLVDAWSDRATSLDAPLWRGLFGTPSELPSWLAEVDLAVVLRPDRHGLLVGNLTAAGVARVLQRSPSPVAGLHQVENLCRVVAPLGLRCEPWAPLRVGPTHIGSQGPPRVLVHPGSGGTGKVWPLPRFLRLCEVLAQRGCDVAVVLGPAELERGVARLFREAGTSILTPPTIAELARRLAAASLVVGNDSGVSHLAAALGRPLVALFGPTDPAVWAPRGPRVTVVAARNAGRPGSSMEAIPFDRVLEVVDRVLSVGAA